jgi:hypothetical protein
MSRFWPKLRHTAALLLAVAAMGHAQLVLACASTASGAQRGPCCPPEIQQPAGADNSGCEKAASERTSDCAAVFDLVPAQPTVADHLSAQDAGDSLDVQLAPLAWPTPPVTAHLRPPPLGPPVSAAATLPGKHTYLATLRLRI